MSQPTLASELTKHVSLTLTQPAALLQLLQTGSCSITLDESLFDRDHPGQYFRNPPAVSVALTIPIASSGAFDTGIVNRPRPWTAVGERGHFGVVGAANGGALCRLYAPRCWCQPWRLLRTPADLHSQFRDWPTRTSM